LRDNGAIEGGAAAFEVGDEVLVLKKITDTPELAGTKVIGHTDGVRACWNEYLVVSLLENAYPHTGVGLYCIVWDLKNNCMATNVTLNTSTPELPLYASFPCLASSISIWLAALSLPTVNGSVFVNGQAGRRSPPDTVPPYYDGSTNGSASGAQPSWPTLLGTTDTSDWVRVASGTWWWDGPSWHWDWTKDQVFNYLVQGCYGYRPWENGELKESNSRGLEISPYFTDYAGETSYYQWYSSLQIHTYSSSAGYEGYFSWEVASVSEDTTATVANYLGKTPYGTLYTGTHLSSSSTVITTTPGAPGGNPVVVTTATSSTQDWAVMPAFGRSDKYTKKNIIHIANISTSLRESSVPGDPGGTITIAHYVEAFTHSCEDTSKVNPLTISSNTALKSAIEALLDQETTAQGIPLSSVKLYRVSGEIKKTA